MPQVASLYLNEDERQQFIAACKDLKLSPYAAIKQFALDLIEKHQENKKKSESTSESGSGTEGRRQETVKVSY